MFSAMVAHELAFAVFKNYPICHKAQRNRTGCGNRIANQTISFSVSISLIIATYYRGS